MTWSYELGSGISFTTDIMDIPQWFGRQILICESRSHHMNMRLVLRWERFFEDDCPPDTPATCKTCLSHYQNRP